MKKVRIFPLLIALGTLLAGAYLLWYRGGYLSLIGAGLGFILLIKVFKLPHRSDMWLVPLLSSIWGMAWAGLFYAVIFYWEEGDVTAVTIPMSGESHTARIWMIELDGLRVGTYVADPEVVAVLRSDATVSLEMEGNRSQARPEVADYATLDPDLLNEINTHYFDDYDELNEWTTIYYTWLGSIRSRETVLITFHPI